MRGKQQKKLGLAGLITAGLLASNGAMADIDGEREALARLLHELRALEPIVQEAQEQADPERRVKFEYLWLRKDLAKMRQGIQDYVEGPRSEPRKFAPLRGDYRR